MKDVELQSQTLNEMLPDAALEGTLCFTIIQ